MRFGDKLSKKPIRARMTEVAKAAGVSLATVSRAMRNVGSVDPDLRNRVMEAADRLGYIQSPIAGGLSAASTRLIGVVVPSLHNAFFADTLHVLSTQLAKDNYRVMIGLHGYDLDEEERLIKSFAAWKPAAIVVTGIDHRSGAIAALLNCGCPIIEMWDFSERALDSVIGFSHKAAGRAAAEHLISRAHERLAYVRPPSAADPRASARASGFIEAAVSKGVPVQALMSNGMKFDSGSEILRSILEDARDASAVAFSGDALAAGALLEANRLGIRVPDELAIIGYGDLDFAKHMPPPLTTVQPPHDRIAESVVEHILARLSESGCGPRIEDLGTKVIVRSST